LPDVPALADPPGAEEQAALGTAVWAWRRLEIPIGVSGADATAIIERLRSAGVDARPDGPASGPNRLIWLAPDAGTAR
jgi:hypothetical protein